MENLHAMSYTLKQTIFTLKTVLKVRAEESVSSPSVATLFDRAASIAKSSWYRKQNLTLMQY